jgi:hypothetical protein
MKRVAFELEGLHAKITPVKMNRGQSIIQTSDTVVLGQFPPEGREDVFIDSDALEDQSIFANMKLDHEKSDMKNEIYLLKKKMTELEEKQRIMDHLQQMIERHEDILEAFKFLVQKDINLKSIFKMSDLQMDYVIREINFALKCTLPSLLVSNLKNLAANKRDQEWLHNELFQEKLLENGSLKKLISRYASENFLDFNLQFEILKYTGANGRISIQLPARTINFDVFSNLHADQVTKHCMKRILKEQQRLEESFSSESTWFFCPVLDFLNDDERFKTYDHFYVFLFNLRRISNTQSKAFQLRGCSLNSLRRYHISRCMSELGKQFLNQPGFSNHIKFGEFTQQSDSFRCSTYVISYLEALLRTTETAWKYLDDDEDFFKLENEEVPGGYYASKLIRLLILTERSVNGDLKSIIRPFDALD